MQHCENQMKLDAAKVQLFVEDNRGKYIPFQVSKHILRRVFNYININTKYINTNNQFHFNFTYDTK